MSSDGTAARLAPAVESFVYQDTFAGPTTAKSAAAPEESPTEQPAKSDNLLRMSQEEISRLASEAHAEGLAEGSRQAELRFKEELAKERARISALIDDFDSERSEYYTKVEIELVHLSLAIAAKILRRESQIDPMVVAGLVKVMLEKLQQNTNVCVHVRPEEAASWREYFRDHQGLDVFEDPNLEPKACLLQTELGTAEVGLDTQLKEVEQGFFDLLAQRPDRK